MESNIQEAIRLLDRAVEILREEKSKVNGPEQGRARALAQTHAETAILWAKQGEIE